MKKILHLLIKDNKFSGIIRKIFDIEGVANYYWVEIWDKSFKSYEKDDTFFINYTELAGEKYQKLLYGFDMILIHYLTARKAKLLLSYKGDKPIVWMPWGGDFYNKHPLLIKKILMPQTSRFYKHHLPVKKKIVNMLDSRGWYAGTYTLQKKAVKKIDYVAPVIYDDYELIKKYYEAPHLKFIHFSYGSIEDFVGSNCSDVSGNDILLGNSASLTNNHIEAIDLLSKINIGTRKVYVPLSYGNAKLRDYVVRYGKQKLGNNFVPLLDFLPLDKYNEILQNCGFVLMNHLRQEGMGNIIAFLYRGAKLFMNKENPAFVFLRRNGIQVFEKEELNKESAFNPLNEDEIRRNKSLIEAIRGKEVVEGYIKKLVSL